MRAQACEGWTLQEESQEGNEPEAEDDKESQEGYDEEAEMAKEPEAEAEMMKPRRRMRLDPC